MSCGVLTKFFEVDLYGGHRKITWLVNFRKKIIDFEKKKHPKLRFIFKTVFKLVFIHKDLV